MRLTDKEQLQIYSFTDESKGGIGPCGCNNEHDIEVIAASPEEASRILIAKHPEYAKKEHDWIKYENSEKILKLHCKAHGFDFGKLGAGVLSDLLYY